MYFYESMQYFTSMGAFIEVLSESMYSGLVHVTCWLCLSMDCNDELFRSITYKRQQSWPGGHLVAGALWVHMHFNEIVRRTVPFSDKCILLPDING